MQKERMTNWGPQPRCAPLSFLKTEERRHLERSSRSVASFLNPPANNPDRSPVDTDPTLQPQAFIRPTPFYVFPIRRRR